MDVTVIFNLDTKIYDYGLMWIDSDKHVSFWLLLPPLLQYISTDITLNHVIVTAYDWLLQASLYSSAQFCQSDARVNTLMSFLCRAAPYF